jgi:ZIP family zinc transporter
MKIDVIILALVATLGTWFVTALGAATVIFFKKTNHKFLNAMLGFAAGVMIAASFWSLLQPAIERVGENSSFPAWLIVTIGFMCGAIFIWISDKVVCYAQNKANEKSNVSLNLKLKRVIMLLVSITIHNIPEGLAVGVAFGALHNGYTPEALMAATSVAVGIALQNFPEGAAVSIPLRREGCSRLKSFMWGQASGMVEPIAGVLGAILVIYVEAILPFALAFAAGAMILVAVHELIPECQSNKEIHPYFSTMGIIVGFSAMMLLDVMLG